MMTNRKAPKLCRFRQARIIRVCLGISIAKIKGYFNSKINVDNEMADEYNVIRIFEQPFK